MDYVGLFIATPYPGTELADICRAQGYIYDALPYDALRVRRASISTADWTAAELERMVSREQVWLRLRRLAHPRIFAERVLKRIWSDPRWALGHARRLLDQWRS